MVVSAIATLVSAAHGTPAAWADSGASASVAMSARDTRRRSERYVMGHLFDAGEQQCSTQRGRPFAWAALAPKKRGVLAPPVASVTPVSSALAGRRLRGTPAPYRIAAPMLDRRRFLKLAGLTALAAAAPRIGEPTEHAGDRKSVV